MRKATYTINIENNNTEEILNEIDEFLIEMEQKHPQLKVIV